MQTQRDHVHAHQFQMGRMSSALVLGDPGSEEIPARRALIGLLAGILVGLLALTGFAVYGWLVPGGDTSWREPGAILVEKQTGNRFVYLGGRLRPVPDLTSAMLAVGGGAVQLVSAESLAAVPRGPMIGLAGAPQSPPNQKNLVNGPWLVCLAPSRSGGQPIGVNLDPSAAAAPLAADRFVLVGNHLVHAGMKHRIGDGTVTAALGLTGEDAIPGDADWLGALPDGPVISAARLPGEGTVGPAVAGVRRPVGQLFRQPGFGGAGDQTFILSTRGLVPVDAMESALLRATTGRTAVPVTAAEVAASVRAGDRTFVGRLPDLTRARIERLDGRAVCQRQRFADGRLTTDVVLTDRQTAAVDGDGRLVRPGSGMVVFGLPVEQRSAGRNVPLHLISDEGIVYPLADDESRRALRLGDATPVGVPRWVLSRLPAGPVLSRPAETGANSPSVAGTPPAVTTEKEQRR